MEATNVEIRHARSASTRRRSHLSHVLRETTQLTLPGVTSIGDAALASIYEILRRPRWPAEAKS